MRLFKIHPLLKLVNSYVVDSPQPSNLSYWWNFGSLLAFSLIIQIITGVTLAMHYSPNIADAFDSVEHIMRDINNGWLIRYLHSNTASAFFFIVYLHIGRGLYYGSYVGPRTLAWAIGTIIFILMMGTAFLGYVLPFGQMSLWGATVITSLMSAIPWVGQDIVEFIWGGFSVNGATLNRFFALHFVLPFILAAMALMHLIVLHDKAGSGNPLGVSGNSDRLPFAPYFIFKDLITIFIFILILSIFVFYMPNILGDSENYVKANPMQTPPAIVPEWYLLAFYAILRSIPNKLLGVIAMFSAILMLLSLIVSDLSRLRGIQFKPLSKVIFFFFTSNFLVLTLLGARHVESPFIELGQISTVLYFFYFFIIVPYLSGFENNLCEVWSYKYILKNIDKNQILIYVFKSLRKFFNVEKKDDSNTENFNEKKEIYYSNPSYVVMQSNLFNNYNVLRKNKYSSNLSNRRSIHTILGKTCCNNTPVSHTLPTAPVNNILNNFTNNGVNPDDHYLRNVNTRLFNYIQQHRLATKVEEKAWNVLDHEEKMLRDNLNIRHLDEIRRKTDNMGGKWHKETHDLQDKMIHGLMEKHLIQNHGSMNRQDQAIIRQDAECIAQSIRESNQYEKYLNRRMTEVDQYYEHHRLFQDLKRARDEGNRFKRNSNNNDSDQLNNRPRGHDYSNLPRSQSDAPRPWGVYFQDSGTPQMEALVELHDNIMFYLIIILFGVGWLLLTIINKYGEMRSPLSQRFASHGTSIEVIWTVTPGIILILIAFPSYKLLYLMDEISDPILVIFVEGHQWYWSYQYIDFIKDDDFIEYDSYLVPETDLQNGALRMLEVDNRIIMPELTHTRFIVGGSDVIHSFACPSLGLKCDAYPGRLNQSSLMVNRSSTYYGQCSEICGILHSSMPIVIEAVSIEKFVKWVLGQ